LVSNRVKDIEKTKKIFLDLKKKVEKNRLAFSNSNMVRMREAIRYLSPDKLEIFIKIPFLLHINSPGYPGFTDSEASVHGIWNFLNSGFYKEAANQKLFPRSIIELGPGCWQGKLRNVMEDYVIQEFPSVGKLKQDLLDMGAVYASMSGSGSTVFAIFREIPEPRTWPHGYRFWQFQY